jgi:DNA-binding NtrC family response regulator
VRARWFTIRNPPYSQWAGRDGLFEGLDEKQHPGWDPVPTLSALVYSAGVRSSKTKNRFGKRTLAGIERRAILASLKNNAGNKLAAARELGIGKTTLYRKLHEYFPKRKKPKKKAAKKRK